MRWRGPAGVRRARQRSASADDSTAAISDSRRFAPVLLYRNPDSLCSGILQSSAVRGEMRSSSTAWGAAWRGAVAALLCAACMLLLPSAAQQRYDFQAEHLISGQTYAMSQPDGHRPLVVHIWS